MDEKEIKRLIKDISELDDYSSILVKRIKFQNLTNAVVDHHDVTLAIPILTDALKNNDRQIRRDAAWALTCHYASVGDWDNVKKLMEHGNADVREAAIVAPAYYYIKKPDGRILALLEAAKNGIDAVPTVSALTGVLKDKDEHARWGAFECLVEIAEDGEHALGLKGIKEAAIKIRKIPHKQERRKLINKLAESTQQIHDKMNPDKKTFPVKHQPVKIVRKKVTING